MAASVPEGPREGGRLVLVIEDHDDGRESLCLLLRVLGHRVVSAPDGPEGVRLAIEVRPDVCFIDLGLPGLGGVEVGRQVRAALGPQRCWSPSRRKTTKPRGARWTVPALMVTS